MRGQQNVAGNRLRNQIPALALAAGIFVAACIRIRPAVKPALLDVRKVVRHQIVAQRIALLDGGPQYVRPGIPPQPDRIARPGREDLVPAAVRVKPVDGGAHRILAGIDIRPRTDADVHLFALPVEQNRPSPMALPEVLQRHDLRARAGGHRLGVILVPLDGGLLADVQVVLPKRKSVRAIEIFDQLLALLALNQPDTPFPIAGAVAHQQFLMRSQQHEPRNRESG